MVGEVGGWRTDEEQRTVRQWARNATKRVNGVDETKMVQDFGKAGRNRRRPGEGDSG